jgi:molecular chaperone HscA
VTGPGARAGCAVAIDLGSSNTVAILRWADGRTRPLLFDGRPVLPSAVFVASDGTIHAGRDAERMAQLDPASYDPNPKRRIDEGAVLLGGREVPVAELLAAILRAVARAATEAVGFLPALVLTYPAAWGTPRRQTLAEAAARAGWPPPRLVPEPVAAARYFTEVMRRPVPPGGTIAVFDFGGGTLDVALVRRDGTTFTVTGWGGAEDLGGLDVDAALVAHLGKQLERDQPAVWRQLSQPVEEIDRRHRRLFWEDVRAAKEMLSRTSLAPIAVPGVNTSLHVTREELEELARPLVKRAVAELVTTVQRSRLKVEDLAAVFLVGGASRIPLVAQLLHTELGIAPTVLEQPELPVAEGALADLVGSLAPRGRPAPRQMARPAPVATGAMTGMPISGMPVSSLPVSGTPAARMPVSATPYPAPPGRVPMPPPPQPFLPMAKPKRTGMHPALVVFIVLAVVGAATAGLVVFVVSQSKPASKATFQAMAEVQTIQTGLKAPDAFVRSFLTESRGVTIGQVDRHLTVSVIDLATKAPRNTQIGDSAGYDSALMAGDMAVVLSKAEGGKRKLYGVNTVNLQTWTAQVGGEGVLLLGDNAPQVGNAPILLWLDRPSGRMTHLVSTTGKQFGNTTDGLPPNWQVMYHPGAGPTKVVLVLADGAVYEIHGDKPTKVRTDPLGGTVVGRISTGDVIVAGGQNSYQISIWASGSRTHGFSGPASRAPIWVNACQGGSVVCVIDEVLKDATSREIGVYSTSGNQYYRAPVPYADITRAPEFLGPNGDGDVIVSTKSGDVEGAVVFSPTFRQIGEYQGRVVGLDRTRAIQVAGPAGPGPVQVTLTGLDLTPNVSTKIGTPTVRRAGCSWNLTSLLCPTEKDFTLWRITK